MSLGEFVTEAINFAVVGAVGAGLALLCTRTYLTEKIKGEIKSEYDHRLELHKAQLKGQADVEIEKLKSGLSVAAAERHLRFAKLHDRRAEAIFEIYKLLQTLQVAMHTYVNVEQWGGGTDEQRRTSAQNAHVALEVYFNPHRIFIPKATAKRVEDLLSLYRKSFFEYLFKIEKTKDDDPYYPDITPHTRTERWMEISDRVDNLSSTALAELEDEFRRSLGEDL